jgi:hypothetical protein
MSRSRWAFRGLVISVVGLLAAASLTLGESNLTTDGPAGTTSQPTSRPHATSRPIGTAPANANLAALAAKAQAIYLGRCARCHGKNPRPQWIVAGQPLKSPLYIYCTKARDPKHLLGAADQKVIFDWITAMGTGTGTNP